MRSKVWNRGALVSIGMKILAVSTIMFGLLACGHHPAKEATKGDKFLGSRTVETVYHDSGKSREYPPIQKFSEFEIIREPSGSNTFKFVPGQKFFGDPAWSNLTLEYNEGIDTDTPIPLIAEICAKTQRCNQNETAAINYEKSDRYVNAKVQNDFINLDGRGLEFLEGRIQFDNKEHIIHVFHIIKAATEKPSLLIFYCNIKHCNHNGMIDAK